MVVMFTAMAPGRGCQICREVMDEYQIVANSWRFSNAYSNSELFFASVDFDEGSEVNIVSTLISNWRYTAKCDIFRV